MQALVPTTRKPKEANKEMGVEIRVARQFLLWFSLISRPLWC
jgi:hypothetical protein